MKGFRTLSSCHYNCHNHTCIVIKNVRLSFFWASYVTQFMALSFFPPSLVQFDFWWLNVIKVIFFVICSWIYVDGKIKTIFTSFVLQSLPFCAAQFLPAQDDMIFFSATKQNSPDKRESKLSSRSSSFLH